MVTSAPLSAGICSMDRHNGAIGTSLPSIAA